MGPLDHVGLKAEVCGSRHTCACVARPPGRYLPQQRPLGIVRMRVADVGGEEFQKSGA